MLKLSNCMCVVGSGLCKGGGGGGRGSVFPLKGFLGKEGGVKRGLIFKVSLGAG